MRKKKVCGVASACAHVTDLWWGIGTAGKHPLLLSLASKEKEMISPAWLFSLLLLLAATTVAAGVGL